MNSETWKGGAVLVGLDIVKWEEKVDGLRMVFGREERRGSAFLLVSYLLLYRVLIPEPYRQLCNYGSWHSDKQCIYSARASEQDPATARKSRHQEDQWIKALGLAPTLIDGITYKNNPSLRIAPTRLSCNAIEHSSIFLKLNNDFSLLDVRIATYWRAHRWTAETILRSQLEFNNTAAQIFFDWPVLFVAIPRRSFPH